MPQVSKNIWDFDPRSVGGCQLWLDAADSLTVTGTTTVTQWSDKSGNARHLGVGSGTTSYSSSAINLAASYMFVTSDVNLTNLTVFIVAKTINVGNQTVFEARPNSGFDYNSVDGFSFFMDNQTGIRFYGQQSTGQFLNFSVNTATPQVFSFQSTGTSVSGWYNGTSQTGGTLTTSRTSTAKGFSIGGSWNGSSYDTLNAYASIYEAIVYNTALTTSQRQQVEGYLAHKWGLRSSLPSTHSFYSIKPHLRIFQPSDFSDLSVWFDASDTSTITGTSTVTAWRDKSSNSWNATTLIGTAPTNTTVNGLNAVSFSGASTLTVSNVAFSSIQSRAVFVVYRVPTSTPNYISFFSTQWSGGNNQGGHNNLIYPSGGGGPFLQSYGLGGLVYTFLGTSSAPSTIGTTAQFAIINSAFSTTSNVVTLNGTSYTLDNGMIAAGYSTSTVTYYIGNSYPQPYILCEYIMYQREFTQSERQIVEGYLANKWGIRSTLPSTHPFKTFPASASLPFLPTNISGCQLWLDGADPAGTGTPPTNGSTVSTWVDKSGNGRNATTYSGTITYSSSLNALLFSDSGLQTSIVTPTNRVGSGFFVVKVTDGSSVGSFGVFQGSGLGQGGREFRNDGGTTLRTVKENLLDMFFSGTTVLNSLMIVGYVDDGTNLTHCVNGTLYTTTNTTTFNSGTTILIGKSFNGEYLIGYIHEVVLFNTTVTSAQRQQVEGYLANKWGLQRSLPTTHAFYKFSPSFNLFSNRFTAPETIVKIGATTYHVFISTGTFTTTISRTVNYLFVGGGGGGADRHGGGGGAGGVQSGTWTPAAGSYTVTVGVGGEGGNYEMNNSFPRGSGLIGGVSTISGVNTALGGGGGGTYDGNPTGSVGSGGGGGGNSLAGVAGTSGQGNSGGAGGSAATAAGGGGGGAGGSGFAGPGQGGVGTTAYSATLLAVGYGTLFAVPSFPNSVLSGGLAYIAGGGGGGTGVSPGPGGSGGLGGGGRGDFNNFFISAGTPNTGGGGGGGRSDSGAGSSGARGGSGLVILWY
jgi:hypothetical protein